MNYKIPYGTTTQNFDVADTYTQKLIEPNLLGLNECSNSKDGQEIVRNAMENPINSPKLNELAKDVKTCTIIISDHTRPVPSKDIIPVMLEYLRNGNPNIDVTLLVATGFHRGTTKEELKAKLGENVYNNEKIVVHDCRKKDSNINLGTLPSGAPFVVDKLTVDCDLLISEGFIEPHFFAGFSGGRKSVLPGVCDQVTVMANHNGKFIANPNSRTGILKDNPIHKDMITAAKMINLAFIVNVVINEEQNTVAAFAGNFQTAHEQGCEFLKKYCAVQTPKFDIVLTGNGGAPLDQNVYQCVKSCTAAESCMAPRGIIIECAECADGHGGQSFYEHIRDCKSPQELEKQAADTPILETEADQWEFQILARILKKHEIVFVSNPNMEPIITDMKMTYKTSAKEALNYAIEKLKDKGIDNPSIGVIPNGISIICN